MSDSLVNIFSNGKVGMSVNYPSSVLMVFRGRHHRRKQYIKNIFEIVK